MLPVLLLGSTRYYFSEKIYGERQLNEEKFKISRLFIDVLSHCQYPGDVIGLSALGLGLRLDVLGTPRILARFCIL